MRRPEKRKLESARNYIEQALYRMSRVKLPYLTDEQRAKIVKCNLTLIEVHGKLEELIKEGDEQEPVTKMTTSKREGWVNLYLYEDGDRVTSKVYNSRESAIMNKMNGLFYIATTKIAWEE